jgi:pimeloyl-ACP methyl ester carboxylesterase
MHPALLDAALHATGLRDTAGRLALPAAWTGVELHATGATTVTARLRRDGDTVSLVLADAAGQPVLTADTAVLRAVEDAEPAAGPAIAEIPVPADRRVAATAPAAVSPRPVLADLPAAAREQAVRDLVLATVARSAAMAADRVPTDRHFIELGLTSLNASELAAEVGAASGLSLETAVFDHPTVDGLTAHVLASLAAPATREPDGTGALRVLFRDAARAGRLEQGLDVLSAAARLRPTTSTSDSRPAPLRLARGPARPRLVCVETPMAMGNHFQYARFAAGFADVRDVVSLPVPGFTADEALPASADVVVGQLADAVADVADGEPFVLVGYSAGGLLAHATATRLAEEGSRPAAVVLLDTQPVAAGTDDGTPDDVAGMTDLVAGLFERESSVGVFTDAQLTGMAWYVDLLGELELRDAGVPVLYLRAVQTGAPTSWPLPATVDTVPGNHFTMMEDEASTTCKAVDGWLAELEVSLVAEES